MDVIIIFNGLGNQMSQYAFYLQKKSVNKSTYLIAFDSKSHNGVELQTVFNISIRETFLNKVLYILFRILLTERAGFFFKPLRWIMNMANCKIIKENFEYNFKDTYLIPSKGITYYYGGWHSEKYFSAITNEVCAAFKFRHIVNGPNQSHVNDILKCNSVAVHIRRGDYLDAENLQLFGDVCTKSYFESATNFISSKVADPHFFIFSNDIEWVRHNLHFNSATYVVCNEKKDSWRDMYLMSLCKYNIISNSTFSWWGAWLNKYPRKIIVSPSRFLRKDNISEIYPDSWIKLSDY